MQHIAEHNQVFQTAAEKAYDILSQKIIKGEYEPGKRLVRRQLAAEMGMSPIPILEAMKRLEQDGLIEYKAHWGSIVTIPTIERVKDLFMLREALECQIARILAVKATHQQAENLKKLADELDEVRFVGSDSERITELHIKFHTMMAEYTGYPSLISGLEKINFNWLLFNALLARRTRPAIEKYWHAKLIDNIVGQDPDHAEKAMREHILDSFVPFLENLQRGQED